MASGAGVSALSAPLPISPGHGRNAGLLRRGCHLPVAAPTGDAGDSPQAPRGCRRNHAMELSARCSSPEDRAGAGIRKQDRFLASIQAGMMQANLPTARMDFHTFLTGCKHSSFGPTEKRSECRGVLHRSKGRQRRS